ncbi:MAG TPA: hypothetical protein VH369_09360 [Bryobacteraceae bacterium]|jgi:hypothetical protein
MIARRSLSRLTRRQWTALVAAAPLAAQVTSKVPPQGAPAPQQPTASPEQKLQKAHADVRGVSEQLSRIEVSMDIEPAFVFRA